VNLGLGNLIELKRYLLAAGIVASSDFDAAITAIGKGIARLFDRHCNRDFERVAGAEDEFSADRRVWVCRRFPVESITSVHQQDDVATGFVALTVNDVILNRDLKAGLIRFGSIQGNHLSQLKVTYTGGYWFDTTEDGSGVQPAGSTLLPEDVKLAWFIQCAEVWNKKDKLGKNITKDDTTFVSQLLMSLDFVPQVKAILNAHIRYQLT
jgi:hypothetical protein